MSEDPGKKTEMAIAIILWLATAALSVVCLLTVRTIIFTILTSFALNSLIPATNWMVLFPMLAFCIAVIIGGFEFHFRNPGTARSWQIFSWTIGIEAAILLLALFI